MTSPLVTKAKAFLATFGENDIMFKITQTEKFSAIKVLNATVENSSFPKGNEWLAGLILTIEAIQPIDPLASSGTKKLKTDPELAKKEALKKQKAQLKSMASELYWELLLPVKAQGGGKSAAYHTYLKRGQEALLSGKDLTKAMKDLVEVNGRGSLKDNALERDDYKCCVTGEWDTEYLRSPGCTLTDDERRTCKISKTEGAHIMPFSIHAQPYTLAILERWGGIKSTKIKGESTNNTYNGLTLCSTCHDEFGKLRLYFHHEAGNRYTPTGFDAVLKGRYTAVEFLARKGHDVPMPDLLRVHAALAKVLHVSGAGEVIERILRDLETVDEVMEEEPPSEPLEGHSVLFESIWKNISTSVEAH